MSDTVQGVPAQPPADTVSVAFNADETLSNNNNFQQPVYSTATETFGPGVEAPRAIQEQQARAATQAPTQHPQRTFTEADLNRARSEANDQVYTTINEMKQQLATLSAEREEAQRIIREQEEITAAAQKAAEEEKMSAKALVEHRTAELQQQIEAMRAETENSRALLEKERQFSALQQWTNNRMAQEDAQNIIPQFRDMVMGNNEEEVEASVQALIARSQAVVQEIQATQQRQWQQAPGVSTRAPGALASPNEMAPGQTQQLGKKELDAMDLATYARLRPQLLAQARPTF